MSGHNRWTQIKHKKGITDAKKSKIFSKLVRFISVEAKLSGGKDSPGLRAAIEKEKSPEGLVWKPNTLVPLSDTDLELLDKLVEDLEENDDVQEVYTNA